MTPQTAERQYELAAFERGAVAPRPNAATRRRATMTLRIALLKRATEAGMRGATLSEYAKSLRHLGYDELVAASKSAPVSRHQHRKPAANRPAPTPLRSPEPVRPSAVPYTSMPLPVPLSAPRPVLDCSTNLKIVRGASAVLGRPAVMRPGVSAAIAARSGVLRIRSSS